MIGEVLVGLQINKSFDYLIPEGMVLKKGMRVLIDFRGKKRVGFLVGFKKKVSKKRKLKLILERLDSEPTFTPFLLKLSERLSSFYLFSQGRILEMMLPPFLRLPRKIEIKSSHEKTISEGEFSLYYIRENFFLKERFLYYRKFIQETISKGLGTIVCFVQKEDMFEFKNFLLKFIEEEKISLLYSAQKKREQLQEWLKIREGKVQVCLGMHFSLFAPFSRTGLIIIERESFYGHLKEAKPFYHSRDVSFLRAGLEKSRLILSSDYPSFQAYKLIQERKAELINLYRDSNPRIRICDLRNYKFRRYPIFSEISLQMMRKFLEEKKRILIFWQRKGFSYLLKCSLCSTLLFCPRCEAYLIFSADKKSFICNKCGYKRSSFIRCKTCKEGYIKNIGIGTERLEFNLRRFFPDKRIERLEKNRNPEEEWDILITTSRVFFLTKNIGASLVIASDIDGFLSKGDFSSTEELFFNLERLKELAQEEFLIFTFHPDYYPFVAFRKGLEEFYQQEEKIRRGLRFPPYGYMVRLTLRYEKEDTLLKKIEELNKIISRLSKGKSLKIYGPSKALPFKLRGYYSYNLFIKSQRIRVLRNVLREALHKFRPGRVRLSLLVR